MLLTFPNMDPDKLVERNSSSNRAYNYEPVFPMAFENPQFSVPKRSITIRSIVEYMVGDKNMYWCILGLVVWIALTAVPWYFGISLIIESNVDEYVKKTCYVQRVVGPTQFSSNSWVCTIFVTFQNATRYYELVNTPANVRGCQLYGTNCNYDVAGDCFGDCWYVPAIEEVHTSDSSSTRTAGISLVVVASVLCLCGSVGACYASSVKKASVARR